MPAGLALHVVDAFALDGVRDDAGRALALRIALDPTQERSQRSDIVTVDLMHGPAEGAPLVRERLDAHDVVDLAVELITVAIHDRDEIAQAVVRRAQRGLPHL